ncbi:hypothetical protein AAG906_022238 [Vitis piasezkii]
MTFVLLFSHRDLNFNKLNGEIPNLDVVYTHLPHYMGYGGGHKSGALRDRITWGKGFQYLWGLPLFDVHLLLSITFVFIYPTIHSHLCFTNEIDLSYSNFSEQSALPSCRDSLQELFLSKLNLVKL